MKGFDPAVFGDVLNIGWKLKRELADVILNERIDQYYE